MNEEVSIKIRNYRCFGNTPQEIKIRPGFTALVGPNNSGKTAFLKMFFEMRKLWIDLSKGDVLTERDYFRGVNASYLEFDLQRVKDSSEIINDTGSEPVSMSFFFPNKEKSIELSFNIYDISGKPKIRVQHFSLKVDNESVEVIGGNNSSSQSIINYKFHRTTEDGVSTGTDYVDFCFLKEFFSNLAESFYVPAFRNIVNIGEKENYFDIATGAAFVRLWNDWQTGDDVSKRKKLIKISTDIQNLLGYKSFKVQASSDQTTLVLEIDGKPYTLQDVGSGIAQFILTFANIAIKQPAFLFIDEPELNLHPALQLKFLTSLGSYVRKGVIFATHSLGLARSVENIFSILKVDESIVIRPFGAVSNYSLLIGELSFSSYREIGANCILYVEGATDIRTMQEFLRKFNKDNKVLIMQLGGRAMINSKREREFLDIKNGLGVKIYAWIDSEKKTEEESLSKERKDFIDMCDKLGINGRASERRAIENYFTEGAISSVFPSYQEKTTNFFDLRDNWSKASNWKIAQAMKKEDLVDTDLGRFIETIE